MTGPDDKKASRSSADANTEPQHPLLGLKIPSQSAPKADNMLLDPKETEAWFDALPMANIGETARQVYNTLIEFNRIELPDLLRAKTVEKFRPPVEYITSNLQKHYIDIGLPLSAKGWKTASLARELQKELATSYKIIVERMIGGDGSNFDRRLLVIALHRALHYLGQTLLQNALIYSAWPDGMWREINSIFAYASQNHVHQVPVKPDDGRQNAPSTTIEDLFKALMLFASSTPHRLRQSHARLLFANLADWTRYTSILHADDGGTSLGRFNVDLWSDSAPMHNSLRTPVPGKRIAILDVRELLKKLRSDFEDAPWDNRGGLQSGKPVVTRPLLRLLIMAWSRPPDRRFVRTKLNFDLRVVAGLHAVYGNLKSDDDTPYAPTRTELFTLEETDSADGGPVRKVRWSTGSLEDVSLAPLDSDLVSDSLFADSRLFGAEPTIPPARLREFAEEPRDHDDKARDEHEPHAVKTINESAGGYCIRWVGEGIPRVKIGELIGVESPSNRTTYGLGVIRWMKQMPDQALDLGLEVISTRCEAADVREAGGDSPRNRAPSYKCLVVNDTDPASNATASLVLSAMNLQTGIDLVLNVGGREQLIRLSKLVEFSSAFARYHFEMVKSDDDADDGDERPGDEFSDLWGNL
ncbi:MAG: hypothetical protein QNJ91_06125 [Gammaproteobacteria bacterium]|nr:hypothetical protein [Gammaproteobacteria bacterium]